MRGAPAPPPPSVERKVVTILFADLAGSTALQERLDPESARGFMERYYGAMRAAVDAHGGTVVKLLGDGVMAAFGVPRVAEDDAMRAVRAGVAMQQAIDALATAQAARVSEIGLRIAINTGEVVVSSDDSDVVGDPVNVAARLQQEAGTGEVVIGESTQRLVASLVTLAPLGSFALKGRTEAVKAFRLVSMERPAAATTAAFIGRDDELARLTAVYDAAVAAPAARLAVLLGSPGLGKSRLVDELGQRLGATATVIAAQCDAGGGGTFAPLAAALRRHLAIDAAAGADVLRAAIAAVLPSDDADRGRVAGGIAALLAGSPASPEETFFVVRRLLVAIGATRPVVLVIDDLHWAEPLLLDLVEHLIQWGSGVPLLVLVGARPELRDTRPALTTTGGHVSEVVTLTGLDAGAATRLAANVIGAADLPATVAAKLLATSEGNPLFIAELVRMLVQEGALTRDGERWIVGAGLAALEMPPTIHALLAARIEKLQPEDRAVLERAAVVGRHFSRNAVVALLPHGASGLDARLESLKRSELIEAGAGWFLGEPLLRFHHVLIRDAAYRRLLKGTRAELHGRFADWVEARVGEAVEHDETIGRHLEQAHQHLSELGPLDAHGRGLGERASRRLAAAGRRALASDDVALAAGLLGRAIARLDADADTRADLALDWCEALLAAGDVGPAADAIAGLARHPDRRLCAWHTCFTGQLTVMTAPQGLQATADAVAAAAAEFIALGDAAGEAKAHQVHAQALGRLGKMGACEAALDRALAAARRAGDRRRANAVLAGAPLAALWGPSPVTRASGRCLDVVRVLRITQGAPAVEAVALSCQGVLEALRGRTEAARRMVASSRRMVEELGITHRLLEADAFAGRIELLEGNAPAAERLLRIAYEGLRDLGLGIDAARAAALLARALLAQGRAVEAEALSRDSEALAGDDLQAAIAWRGVRAEALAQRGEHRAAVALAQAAVAIAAMTDALLDHADARLALAAALRAAGRRGDAEVEMRRVIELWETKGATLLVERVRGEGGRASIPPAGAKRPRATLGRARSNAALRCIERYHAGIVARDVDALLRPLSPRLAVIHHPTGTTYGAAGIEASWRAIFEAGEMPSRMETEATLGGSLALVRLFLATAGTPEGAVGPSENESLLLVAVDEDELAIAVELFAADRLGDAVASLYGRYAERLPDGPACARAHATAAAIGAMVAPPDLDRYATALAPWVEFADHRTVGFSPGRGATKLLRGFRSLLELATDVATRVDEVVRLEPDAILLRWTTSGTDRGGGGAFESQFLLLWVFGSDGLIVHDETFDAERDADAGERFDDLVRTAARWAFPRMRPNAASELTTRFQDAFAAGDDGALRDLFAGSLEVVDHPNGVTYGRDGHLASLRRLRRAKDPMLRFEPIATCGESLLVSRRHITGSGTGGPQFDVGEYEREEIVLFETDEVSCRHIEVFAADHLVDAVACLYERCAAALPEGAVRDRAGATAHAVAALLGPFDLDRFATAVAPDVAVTDHRRIGLEVTRGVDAWLADQRALHDLAGDLVTRVDDVLALCADALLVRWSTSGTDRPGGGPYERRDLWLGVFGADGRVARLELFESDHVADALARFDALAGAPMSSAWPFTNTATRTWGQIEAAWLACDAERFARMFVPALCYRDRRRMVLLELDRDGLLAVVRPSWEIGPTRATSAVVATRGEHLALARSRLEFAGGDVGQSEIDTLFLVETNAAGSCVAYVRFDADDLATAYTELDQRYDAGEGAACPAHGLVMRAFSEAVASRDWTPVTALCASTFVEHDHRTLAALGTTRGAEAWAQNFRALTDLAPDTVYRVHHFRSGARGFWSMGAWQGSREGGGYEIPINAVIEVDQQDRIARADIYDVEQLDQARERFAELAASVASPERFANAATATVEPVMSRMTAHDWQGFAALFSDDFRISDRRRLVQLELDRDQYVAFTREVAEGRAIRAESQVLVTRGDRLALTRGSYEFTDGDVGPSEIAFLIVTEVDDRGRIVGYVRFDLEDEHAAVAELDARWAAGEGAEHMAAFAAQQRFSAALGRRDWDAMAALHTPSFVGRDHRLVGWGTLRGSVAFVKALREMVELAPDAHMQWHHVRTTARGVIADNVWVGTRDGGAFESPFIVVTELDGAGLTRRCDFYDPDHLEQAFSRFHEIGTSHQSSKER
ncbi:MAG TPA: nuclear transport factor 2 family protein [Candidatus Binatia bacterium]|nr:nuclear transport factor 2 family protein [Candidatus Binatia bacterium]